MAANTNKPYSAPPGRSRTYDVPDPRSSTVRNTNGLLREYFPKSTDLSIHGPEILENVAAELNPRPRKRHGYQTPAEVLATLISNPTNQTSVAPTT